MRTSKSTSLHLSYICDHVAKLQLCLYTLMLSRTADDFDKKLSLISDKVGIYFFKIILPSFKLDKENFLMQGRACLLLSVCNLLQSEHSWNETYIRSSNDIILSNELLPSKIAGS